MGPCVRGQCHALAIHSTWASQVLNECPYDGMLNCINCIIQLIQQNHQSSMKHAFACTSRTQSATGHEDMGIRLLFGIGKSNNQGSAQGNWGVPGKAASTRIKRLDCHTHVFECQWQRQPPVCTHVHNPTGAPRRCQPVDGHSSNAQGVHDLRYLRSKSMPVH
jgi:hypothetical protein